MRSLRIIGAGPAGLALGCGLLRAGVPASIDEAGDLPRHRVCGEFLCGRGTAVLERLGLGAAIRGAPVHRRVEWFRGSRHIFSADLPQAACGISRHRFDASLARIFRERGGELRTRSRVDSEAEEAAGTVLASGRTPARSGWIGLKAHFFGLDSRADLEMHLGDRGYVGVARVEDGRTNICGLFRRRPGTGGGREEILGNYLQACGLATLADRFKAARPDPRSCCAVAGAVFSAPPPAGSHLRLGDAFGAMPPFTGNGMSLALETAEQALPHLVDYAEERRDWTETVERVHARLERHFGPRLAAAGRLHPWIARPARQRVLATFATLRLLPFGFLFRRTH